jgi:hypothetical protein
MPRLPGSGEYSNNKELPLATSGARETGLPALWPEMLKGCLSIRLPSNYSQPKEMLMAKLHARPSLQYRYEHYDPRMH